MYKNSQYVLFSLLFFALSSIYFLFFSDSGILERARLQTKIKKLELDIERLEIENSNLQTKQKKLLTDEKVLSMEARKFYLLSKDARIIKYADSNNDDNGSNSGLFASQLPNESSYNKKLSQHLEPPKMVLKLFYIITSIFLGVGFYLKFNKNKGFG